MERGRGTFIRTEETPRTAGPSRFERLEQSADARELNLFRFREAEQARRRRPTIAEVIQQSREKRVLEAGFASESDSPVAKAILFLAITGSTAGVISACGGGDSADNPTQTDTSLDATPGNTLVITATPGETPEVTPEVTFVPTPELTPAPKRLADAQFVPTNYASLESSLKSAFDAHPDASEVFDEGNNQITREKVEANVQKCRDGIPGSESPDGGRLVNCGTLVYRSLIIYRSKGYEEFYQLAVDGSNYTLTELPQFKDEFIASVEGFAHDSPPK